MSKRFVNRFRNLLFSSSEWALQNPILLNGEVGFEYDDGDATKTVKRFKVGSKTETDRWNDLPYYGSDVGTFTLDADVSNPIGDAVGNLLGKPPEEILRLILNPYKVPEIVNLRNDAAGAYANTAIREIGNAKSGTVTLNYTINNFNTLSGANPINVDAGGLFTNEGNKPYANISLTLASTLNPGLPVTYEISIKAFHLQGQSPIYKTYIKFVPKLIWGVSANADETASGINALSGKTTRLSDTVEGDYYFGAAGYRWLAIPDMIDKADIYFLDITVPQVIVPDGFSLIKTVQVNNGVGVYNYALYRSDYNINQATKMRIAR